MGLNHNKPLYNMENNPKTIKQSKTWSLSIEAYNNETNEYDLTLEQVVNKIKHETHYYFGINHDKDITENGEIRKSHFHIVLKLKTKRTKNGLLKRLAQLLEIDKTRISARITKSQDLMIRYLIHLDNKDKYQYSPSEILTNRKDILNLAIKGEIEREDLTAENLILTVERFGGNKLKIMSEIGLKNYQRFRGAILDIINQLENDQHLLTMEQKIGLIKKDAKEQRERIKKIIEYEIEKQKQEIENTKNATIKGIRKEINEVAIEVLRAKKGRK